MVPAASNHKVCNIKFSVTLFSTINAHYVHKILVPSGDKFKKNNSQNLEKLVCSSGHISSPIPFLLLQNILVHIYIIHDRALNN
jgi:hypothetical protein